MKRMSMAVLYCWGLFTWRAATVTCALCLASLCNLSAQAISAVQAKAADLSATLPTLKLSYSAGKTLTIQPDWYPDRQDFQPIAIYCDQTLQVSLQFPPGFAGQAILVGVADGGGLITTPSNSAAVSIGKDGKASFAYQAPHSSGHYRIGFRFGSRDSLLPLAVIEPSLAGTAPNCPRAD